MARDASQQNLEAATGKTDAGAKHALQAEADALRGQPTTDNTGVILVTVQPKDSIRSIGRFLYQRHLHRAPTDIELKEFVDDTARRNDLTAQQRDHLELDQKLKVKIPGSPSAPHRTETPRTATSTTTAPETHRLATRPATTAQACSGYVAQIGSWITHNEAGRSAYTAYNPDDAGNGISVGLMQWNQKAGKLPDLIKAWHAKNPDKFEDMFGGYSDDMLSTSFVRSANFTGNKTLASGISQALSDREFQQVQLNMRNGHIRNSCELANDHRFTSVRGTAVVADLVNQIGPAGTARALRKVSTNIANESLRIEELKRITGWRTNSGDRVGVIEERVKEIWRAEAANAKAKGG
jgi:hypothetical protein